MFDQLMSAHRRRRLFIALRRSRDARASCFAYDVRHNGRVVVVVVVALRHTDDNDDAVVPLRLNPLFSNTCFHEMGPPYLGKVGLSFDA